MLYTLFCCLENLTNQKLKFPLYFVLCRQLKLLSVKIDLRKSLKKDKRENQFYNDEQNGMFLRRRAKWCSGALFSGAVPAKAEGATLGSSYQIHALTGPSSNTVLNEIRHGHPISSLLN